MLLESWIDALGNFKRKIAVQVKVVALGIRDTLAKASCIRAVKSTELCFCQEVVRLRDVKDIGSNIVRNCRWLCLVLVESCLFQRTQTTNV